MIDWLKRRLHEDPYVTLGEARLPVVIRRHSQAKRMTLRLAPDGSEARITIPSWCRTADALEFAQSRKDWLARQLAAVPAREPLCSGGFVMFRGCPIRIDHMPAAPRKPALDGTTIYLGGPQASIGTRLRRWLEGEARVHLSRDLVEYCGLAQRREPTLTLSNARRRWGSCAPDGSIRINWRLIMAPDFVRRSVVAHEVAHLVHFDHSARFHSLLAELYDGDIAEANRWLKRESRGLYLPFG